MNRKPSEQLAELRQKWIESLLFSASAPEENEVRIARAMNQIVKETPAVGDSTAAKSLQRGWTRWWPIAMAASLLLALFFAAQNLGNSNSAMAAVVRSLNVAAQNTARMYSLRVEYRNGEKAQLAVENELYVQGNDRFALRHPGLLPGTSFWLGQQNSEAWVLPAFGPVRKGDNTILSRWLRSHPELDTPYLHVSTLLARMSRGYRLEAMADEKVAVPGRIPIECQHVRAEIKSGGKPNLPDKIELWASRETGMAVRMVAEWTSAGKEFEREKIVLVFQKEEVSLPEDWFTAEGHYEGNRRVLQIDSPSNNQESLRNE